MASDADKIKDDWFENVENFRPLRGGRRAETLNEVASGTNRITNLYAEKKFAEYFEASKLNHEDPLSEMCKFVLWFEEYFPSGKYRLFYPMLYKICTTFCTLPQYKNDERMLKLWLKLAASFPESGFAVMEYAFTKGSCRELAKFYIRWSEMYEFARMFLKSIIILIKLFFRLLESSSRKAFVGLKDACYAFYRSSRGSRRIRS